MTTRDLILLAGQHPVVLAAAFIVPPVAAWGLGQIHERTGRDRAVEIFLFRARLSGVRSGNVR